MLSSYAGYRRQLDDSETENKCSLWYSEIVFFVVPLDPEKFPRRFFFCLDMGGLA